MKFRILFFSLIVVGRLISESSLKPEAPFVAEPDENSSWTVTVSKAPENPTAKVSASLVNYWDFGTPKLVENIKSGKIKREIFTWNEGNKTENWFLENYQIDQSISGEIVACVANPEPQKEIPHLWSSKGFAGLDWVAGKFFIKKTEMNGQECYLYTAVINQDGPYETLEEAAPKSKNLVSIDAYINIKTKMPVRVTRFGYILDYRYKTSGPQTMTLPPAFVKELSEFKLRLGIHD